MSREADSCPQLGEVLIGQLKGGEHFFYCLSNCFVMRQRPDDNSYPNDKTNQTQFPEWSWFEVGVSEYHMLIYLFINPVIFVPIFAPGLILPSQI